MINLDGFESEVFTDEDGIPRRRPLTRVQFQGLSLLDQLFHTVASPPVAYLLLIIGMGLLLFEFFSIGVGIAGVIGGVCLLLGSYGLAVLPFRTWALALLVLAMVAYAVDIQTAVPGLWTAVGTALFTVGTIFLYPESHANMSWIPMLVGIVGMAVVMYRGMPIMVRGRFSTTFVPRDFLVDQQGIVTEGGLVRIAGAEWPLADPSVAAGSEVVVTAVDDLRLRVRSAR